MATALRQFARRTLAIVTLAALAVAAAPSVEQAFAANAPAPDFTNSAFVVGDDTVSFPTVLSRPNGAVQPPTEVTVKFDQPIKESQAGNVVVPSNNAAAPYFANPATPDTQLAGTAQVDPNDDTVLDVTPPASLPDGLYELHVTVFAQDDCPDAGPTDLSLASCTQYDGFITSDGFNNFQFTTDGTKPTTHISSINSGVSPVNGAAVKSVQIVGTAAGDAQSVALNIKSSAGGSPRFATANVSPDGQAVAWTANVNLSSLADGVVTVTAIATDAAGNKTDPTSTGARKTITLAAHAAAPRSLRAKPRDGGARLTWAAPANTGGLPLKGYVVSAFDKTTSTPGGAAQFSCSSSGCPTSFTARKLTDGDVYRLTVQALTDAGKGAPATTTVRPLAGATLTAASSAKKVKSGRKVTLHGRLTRTATAAGVSGIVLTITPHFAHGRTGTPFRVKTDTFGVWSKTLRPNRSATYVVRWAGNSTVLPATARVSVSVS